MTMVDSITIESNWLKVMKISIDDSIIYGRYQWLWVITMAIGNGNGYGSVCCKHEESISMTVAMATSMASPYCLNFD